MSNEMTPLEAAASSIGAMIIANDLGCEHSSRMIASEAIHAFMEALPKQDRLEYMKRWDGPHMPLFEDAFIMGRDSLRREIEEALKDD